MSTESPDYSQTVNLPKTDFPQKASLAQREPERLAKWERLAVSQQLSARTDKPNFVLHDGPPYANGDIHIGHTLNKVLKDIIVRFKAMTGHRAHYIPGWDCHGLPIEQKVVDDLRAKKQYEGKSALEIRQLCAQYAQGWIDKQREQFKRLGVGGSWSTPYITMDPKFELGILDALAQLVSKGLVYKGLKVVYWDPVFETALAEAEIEYNDNHVSQSIYVKFPFLTTPPVESLKDGASIAIWTTTPWTLPANLGVSVHPQFEYVAYKVNGEVIVVAKELLASFVKDTGLEGGEVLETFSGALLDRQECAHPLIAGKRSLVMVGEHVTLEQGSGAVHTAPGHGVDDFNIGQRYGLEPFNPVDERGCFTDKYPDMQGVSVFKANDMVIERLKESGLLLAHKPYKHSYPYSWRSRKPIIMRATEQWFMNVEKDGLRDKALKECEQVEWIPKWGFDRIYNMLKSRPDWCLSRQRAWGVPIPSIVDKRNGESYLLPEVIQCFATFVAAEGTDAWFARPLVDFLPDRLKPEAEHFEKEFNCLDVWFDSGCTHLAVLNDHYGLSWPADLYLEGSDQHRGWFQSSMWVSLGTKGAAPYKSVLTHGFVLDEKGQPMSKSLGNVISPLDVIKESGADVLRLWVSSEDYRGDVSIGKNGIKQISEAYRGIRNTLRYCLSNLYDYTPANAVAYDELSFEDRWCLHHLNELIRRVRESYDKYEFHRVYQLVNNFCSTQLSALYLDIIKDRLYCSAPDDVLRRSSQTVLYELVSVMSRLLAPVLAFTADEAWEFLHGNADACVHLESFPEPHPDWDNAELAESVERLIVLRRQVTKAIEPLRAKENKVIGNSLEAAVTLTADDPETLGYLEERIESLPTFFIVSQVELQKAQPTEVTEELRQNGLHLTLRVTKATGQRCLRCWKWTHDVGQDSANPALCRRCATAIRRKSS
ncbi:isoleucine--tRNA ligase [bacterium]|nr:isoleucine--tRNA ligase [bacterium]